MPDGTCKRTLQGLRAQQPRTMFHASSPYIIFLHNPPDNRSSHRRSVAVDGASLSSRQEAPSLSARQASTETTRTTTTLTDIISLTSRECRLLSGSRITTNDHILFLRDLHIYLPGEDDYRQVLPSITWILSLSSIRYILRMILHYVVCGPQ
ncbi:hypothetical protein RRF57_003707 [Xylaria bambusicola]|uniref:Uncharacterized protein n=1 Tax=Xylaria bambusicola TaxID=326684 RepID=A0AAN7Z331_9PEZI